MAALRREATASRYRLGLLVAAIGLAFVTLVQAYDAWSWARSPWLGVTLGAHGRTVARARGELPVGLRELYQDHALHAIAVRPASSWIQLTSPDDHPAFEVWSRPRRPYQRLQAALRELEPGRVVGLRVATESGQLHEIDVTLRRLPPRIIFERVGLYAGIGFLILVLGGGVMRALPRSGQALAFGILALCFGGQLLTTQVIGGFPSRFYWLSLIGCYTGPAAAATLALALEPAPWAYRHRWVMFLPWSAALLAAASATLHGRLMYDSNLEISLLRAAGWAFFAGYLLWRRFRTRLRWRRQRLDYFLGGMAITFALPTWHYITPPTAGDPVSPWVMAPLAAFPLVIGYGVLRHRLFDAEVVLRRGLAYAALLMFAAGVYGVLAALAGSVLGAQRVAGSALWTAGLAALALALGAAVRPLLQAAVDRGLNPRRYRYLEALRLASEEIAELDHELDVAERLVQIATRELDLQGAAVFLKRDRGHLLAACGGKVSMEPDTLLGEDEPIIFLPALLGAPFHRSDFMYNPKLAPLRLECVARMDEMGVDLVVPIGSRRRPSLGLLALAPRSDGVRLNSEDLELIKLIVLQAATAIAHATQRSPADPDDVAERRAPYRLGAGRRIGHYLLQQPIGSGGMGTVFRALDEHLERSVALKFLHEERAASERMLRRLRREARTLAQLNHPGIMQIYALEQTGGHTFLATEWVEGRTLRQELERRERFAPADALEVGCTLAGALDYALGCDVIHRDIKLDNVILADSGLIKLMDFGLAKLMATSDSSLTDTGLVVGTPAYLAPELLEGEPASFRSDMYALGLLLYALLCGHERWRGLVSPRQRPPARELLSRDWVPASLMPVLTRLLELEPGKRPDSYAELIDELEQARHQL